MEEKFLEESPKVNEIRKHSDDETGIKKYFKIVNKLAIP